MRNAALHRSSFTYLSMSIFEGSGGVMTTVTHCNAMNKRTSRYPLLSKVRIEGHEKAPKRISPDLIMFVRSILLGTGQTVEIRPLSEF